MLGLTITLMCGTQITAFASDTSVAVETEVKAETPVVEEAIEKLVGFGVSVEAEAETDKTAEETPKEDIKGELTGYGLIGAVDGVLTLTDEDFDEDGIALISAVVYGTPSPVKGDVYKSPRFTVSSNCLLPAEDSDYNGTYITDFFVRKNNLIAEYGAKTYSGTYRLWDTTTRNTLDTLDFSFTVKYGGEIPDIKRPKLSITSDSTTFGTHGIVLTLKAEFDGSFEFYGDIPTLDGTIVGSVPEQVSDKEIRIVISKEGFQSAIETYKYEEGQTAILDTGYGVEYTDENGKYYDVDFPSITLTYSTSDTDNGGSTENPDPEKDGWIKTEEGWKYYENGQKVTGWKAVSEKWYYFNEDGIMATGWASIGGHWYYLNTDGTMATGWASVGGHWYYLNADGSMATGWVSVGGHWYYLNTDGTMATGWASVGGHWYYLNADGSMATGWVSVGGYWYYLNTDGTMASNQWIDGWYVDASGKML